MHSVNYILPKLVDEYKFSEDQVHPASFFLTQFFVQICFNSIFTKLYAKIVFHKNISICKKLISANFNLNCMKNWLKMIFNDQPFLSGDFDLFSWHYIRYLHNNHSLKNTGISSLIFKIQNKLGKCSVFWASRMYVKNSHCFMSYFSVYWPCLLSKKSSTLKITAEIQFYSNF